MITGLPVANIPSVEDNKDNDENRHWLYKSRCIHVPPGGPCSNWKREAPTVWWKDAQYCIGTLTKKTRKIRVKNTLTHQEHLLEVCIEETMKEILDRYTDMNANANSYEWRRLGVSLHMNKNLEENGVPDEDEDLKQHEIDETLWYPALHIVFLDGMDEK